MLIIHCGAQAQALDGGEIEAGEVLCLMAVWEKWKWEKTHFRSVNICTAFVPSLNAIFMKQSGV